MNRNLLHTFFQHGLVLFFSSVLLILCQSCGNKKKTIDEIDLRAQAEEVSDRSIDGVDGESWEGDGTYDEQDAESTTTTDSQASSDQGSISSTASTQPTSTSYSSGGRYVVVAGNYLLEGNADNMVSKLRKEGYGSAEKVVFDLSQYYTVIASRHASRNAAGAASANLKSMGVDNYVVTRE
ncbi:MAG: SPOR domain-containing protein [Bacteroidota bacterium]